MKRKVNLLFYGQPRFVNSPDVYRSIKKIINDYDVDVYGHMWHSPELEYDVSTWVQQKVYVPYNAPGIFQSLYDPEEFIVSKPRKFKFRFMHEESMKQLNDAFPGNQYLSDINISNALSQLRSISEVAYLAESKINRTNENIFVLIRYDGVLSGIPDLNNIPLVEDDKNILYMPQRGSSFNDLVWIFNEKVLEEMIYIVPNEIDESDTRRMSHPIPEEFKRLWFIKNCPDSDFKIKHINMYSDVVRFNNV